MVCVLFLAWYYFDDCGDYDDYVDFYDAVDDADDVAVHCDCGEKCRKAEAWSPSLVPFPIQDSINVSVTQTIFVNNKGEKFACQAWIFWGSCGNNGNGERKMWELPGSS